MKRILYFIITIVALTSCDKWFDVEPEGESAGQGLFCNESSFRHYMNGIYTDLRSNSMYGSNLTLGGVEFLGQTFVPNNDLKDWTEMSTSNFGTKLSTNVYNGMYKAIYECNDLLEMLNSKTDVLFVAGSREMMIGEARALRAFLHFELLRLYHPAYVVNANYSDLMWADGTTATPQKLTTQEMTKRIVSELTTAIDILKVNDPISNGLNYDDNVLLGSSPIDRVWKLNYYAALAVKARVLMTIGTTDAYAQAVTCLKVITESGKYNFVDVSSGTDVSLSAEHLFGLSSTKEGLCLVSDKLFYEQGVSVSPRVDVSLLSPDDRRNNWFKMEDQGRTMSPKFTETSIIADWNTVPRIPIIKIGEVYLMLAEAEAKSNNLPAGIARFNDFMIGRNCGEDPAFTYKLPSSASLAELTARIDQQYVLEFIGEGVRFYYCKRLNQTITSYSGATITACGNKYLKTVK